MAEIIKRHGEILISVSDGWGQELFSKEEVEQFIKELTKAKDEVWQKQTT